VEFHQLRYFCAVAKAGSFTRAAQQQHVSQPSLSQQLRKLEDELGVTLFDRMGRAVRLTRSGDVLLPRAESILRQVAAATLEGQEAARGYQGRLVVGAIPTVTLSFLPSRLASFAQECPRVQVSAVEGMTNELVIQIEDGAIDLAFLALPISARNCVSRELFREPLYLVVSENHALASSGRIHLRKVENDPFLLLTEGHCFREDGLSACARARFKPNVVFEGRQFKTVLEMVAEGMGVSILPEMAAIPTAGCRFIPLEDDGAYRSVGIVQLKKQFPSSVRSAFLEHIGETQRIAGI
jgi:LysR family hydrogen peroxide-inducible transcriptional activator